MLKKFFISSLILCELLSVQFTHTQSLAGDKNPARERNIFISVSGGIDFPNLHGYNKGFGFQGNFGYLFNKSIGLRADMHTDFINREDQIIHNPNGVTEKVTGRNMDFYTFKVDVLYGNFDIISSLNTYILVGGGIREKHFSSRIYEQTYFSYFTNSDTTMKIVNDAYWKTDFSAGVGAGVNFKLYRNFRFLCELQYMLLEGLTMDDDISVGGYSLLKAGIFYNF